MSSYWKTYHLGSLLAAIVITELVFWGISIWLYFFLKDNHSGFKLEAPVYAYYLPALALIPILYLAYYNWKRRAIVKYADKKLLGHLIPPIYPTYYVLRYILLRLGIGLMALSLLNPQFGEEKKAGVAKGIDLVFALDVSKSMESKDLSSSHSRLDIAKRAINKLIKDDITGGRIGLLIFAGNAYKQVALTYDHEAVMFELRNINTNMLRTQGTNIANAIDEALTSFNSKDKTNKAIIVVSDGENHEADAVAAASRAYSQNKVKVYTIGMGTPSGARIPYIDEDGNLRGYIKDEKGKTVLSKLNEDMLKELADKGNGLYIKATSTDLGLDYILEDVNKIKKTEYGQSKYTNFIDQFQWLLGPGLILFILSLLITSDFRSKPLSKSLFTE